MFFKMPIAGTDTREIVERLKEVAQFAAENGEPERRRILAREVLESIV